MSRKKVEKIKRRDRFTPKSPNRAWKSCKSKSGFTEFEARKKARVYNQGIYHCMICGLYHLTSARTFGG